VNQLNGWLKLEAGYQGNFNHENTPVNTIQGTNAGDATINPDLYNRFIYDNDISALYATLGGKAGKLSFSAGLRAEAWQIRTKSLEYGEIREDVPEFKKNSFALFPSAFVSYELPKSNELQINYTRRIRRPWGGQLNSFRDISDPTNISYGNPELQPQYSNAFELNYIKSWTDHIISLSAYYRTSSDMINRVSYMANGVMYSTNVNVSEEANSGCEIVVKNSLFRSRLSLTTTVNLYNNHLKAWSMDFDHDGTTIPVSGNGRDNFSWDVRCMASVRLPWGLSFQATGRYNARMLTAQGSREPGWNVDAGLRKNIGDWSISLNCRDIFDSRKMHNFTYGDTYTQESERWRGGRRIQLTVKYSFGNMKSKQNKRNNQSEPVDGSGYDEGGMQ
jgi:outer membrane receptor protein involved in Fe transport